MVWSRPADNGLRNYPRFSLTVATPKLLQTTVCSSNKGHQHLLPSWFMLMTLSWQEIPWLSLIPSKAYLTANFALKTLAFCVISLDWRWRIPVQESLFANANTAWNYLVIVAWLNPSLYLPLLIVLSISIRMEVNLVLIFHLIDALLGGCCISPQLAPISPLQPSSLANLWLIPPSNTTRLLWEWFAIWSLPLVEVCFFLASPLFNYLDSVTRIGVAVLTAGSPYLATVSFLDIPSSLGSPRNNLLYHDLLPKLSIVLLRLLRVNFSGSITFYRIFMLCACDLLSFIVIVRVHSI